MSGRVVQQLDCQYGARVSTEVSDITKANCGAYPELHNLRSEAFSNTKIARSTDQCVSIDDYALSSSIMANDVEHQEKHLLRTSDSVTLDLEKTARVLSSSKRPSHEIDDGETTHGQKYLKYTKTDDVHGRTHTRVIKLHNASSDPLEPSRVRLQKIPPAQASPSQAVLHSPPRALTDEERAQWHIPPSISNWKNSKGYTIPLDKRLAADGRGLQTTRINDNFAKLSEALYVAEQKSRDAVDIRSKLHMELQNQAGQKHEETLRHIALGIRSKQDDSPRR